MFVANPNHHNINRKFMSALVNPASYPHTSLFFGPSKAQNADTCIYSGEGRMAQQTNNAVIDSMMTLSGVFPPECFQLSCLLSRKYDYSTTIEIVRFPYHTIHTVLSSLPLRSLVRTPVRQQPLARGHGIAGTPRMSHCRAQSVSPYTFFPSFMLHNLSSTRSRVCACGNHTEVGRQRECVGNTRSCRAGQ